MTAEELASQIDARHCGREWRAFCPLHRGKSRSLHFRDGDHGGIVMICRAGCETKDVLAALSLSFHDICPESPRPRVPSVAVQAKKDIDEDFMRNWTPAMKQEGVTIIYTDREHINEAMAEAIVLTCEYGELVHLVLREHESKQG